MLETPIYWEHPTYPLTLNDQSQRPFTGLGYWYDVTSVDGIWDEDVRFEAHEKPQQHGGVSGDAFYQGKTIVLSGLIRAKNLTLLRTAQRKLQQSFYDMTANRLRFTLWAESEVFLTCRKSQKLDMPEQQLGPGYTRTFTLQLYADDPRTYLASAPTTKYPAWQ
jgi:hypothetical protein